MNKFLKKNKSTIIAIAVFLLIVLVLVQLKNAFFPNEEHAIYGNRLEGRKKVVISNSKKKAIKDSLNSDSLVRESSVRISGRIIEVMIDVNNNTTIEASKQLSTIIVSKLTDKEKKYYDIQVFIKKEENSSKFPIIGYKHHHKKHFSWTKNR